MIDNFLLNKRVLFIAPNFYQYHTGIIKAMENKGAIVTYIPEVNNSILYRFSKKINTGLQQFLERKQKSKFLSICSESSFEILFVIRGELLDKKCIDDIRRRLPQAEFYMYQWDSYLHSDYREVINSFKSVSTFDYNDANELSIPCVPLFYLPEYENRAINVKKEYALSFFGAYHGDRLNVIKFYSLNLDIHALSYRLHLYIPVLSFVFRLIIGELTFSDIRYLSFRTTNSTDINTTYKESVAVLDIELSIQSGLSIRTFEVLKSGAKLITTNINVKNEPFYDASVIRCIDRGYLEFDAGFFLESPPEDVNLDDYSVSKWLGKIFTTK